MVVQYGCTVFCNILFTYLTFFARSRLPVFTFWAPKRHENYNISFVSLPSVLLIFLKVYQQTLIGWYRHTDISKTKREAKVQITLNKFQSIHPIFIKSYFKTAVKMAPNLFMTKQSHVEYKVFPQTHQILLLDNNFRGNIQKLFSSKNYQIIPFKHSNCSQFNKFFEKLRNYTNKKSFKAL